MATRKTILSIEVTKDQYSIQYSGGFKPDWDHLTPKERRAVLRHDSRLCNALIACPEAFRRIAGLVHGVERFNKRRAKEALKAKQTEEKQVENSI